MRRPQKESGEQDGAENGSGRGQSGGQDGAEVVDVLSAGRNTGSGGEVEIEERSFVAALLWMTAIAGGSLRWVFGGASRNIVSAMMLNRSKAVAEPPLQRFWSHTP